MIRLIMDFFMISYLSITDGCVSVLAMIRFINGFLNFLYLFLCESISHDGLCDEKLIVFITFDMAVRATWQWM